MSIQLHWGDDTHTHLVVTFEETWTLQDFEAMVAKASTMTRLEMNLVHVIVEVPHITRTQAGLAAECARIASRHISGQQGAVVFITTKSHMQTAISCVRRLLPATAKNLYAAPNYQVAERIMEHVSNRLLAVAS